MDIHEIADRYHISLKKLRRMHKDGALKVGKSATPKHWQMVVSDIRKGKMSARSIALAHRWPERLRELARLTSRDREILREHFMIAGLPAENSNLADFDHTTLPGAAINMNYWLESFIVGLKQIIPHYHVRYEFIAVRWILAQSEDEEDVQRYSKYIPKALSYARESPTFLGWWHKEPDLYGKYKTIYHRPENRYDL